MHHHKHEGPTAGGTGASSEAGPVASDGVFEGVKGGGPGSVTSTAGQGGGVGPRVNVNVTLQQAVDASGGELTQAKAGCARGWTRAIGAVAGTLQLLAALGGSIALIVILQSALPRRVCWHAFALNGLQGHGFVLRRVFSLYVGLIP